MRFSLLSGAALVALASLGRADDCDSGPFAKSTVAGAAFPDGPDPETNCDTFWTTGQIIVGIEAWSAKFQVKAVRFKYSMSGWGPVRGTIPTEKIEAHVTKEWGVTDEVGIQLWSNKPDDGDPIDAVGRIIITQGGNNIFEVGANKGKVQDNELVVDNGAGLILGAKTRSGAWLSSLEFKMLKSKVMSSELVGVQVTEDLDAWNREQKGIDHINLATVYYVNKNQLGGPNLTYSFTNADSREVKKTIKSETTNQWAAGIKVSVSWGVEIPLLAKSQVSVETSFEYTRTEMDGTEESSSFKKDLSTTLGTPGTSNFLSPQRAARCESFAVSGKFDSDYTGSIEATLADGSKYTYKDVGSITSVGWERADVSCEEIDIKDVPADGKVEEAQPPKRALKRAVRFHV